MQYAVQILKSMPLNKTGRKILIAGDMLELGDQAAALHAGLDLTDIDCVLTLGLLSKNIASGKKVLHFDERDVLWETLKTELKAGDQILIKGSRGMKMEWFVEKLKEQLANG
jgi:UDP-N-acetylmuramoyl-tripeptide--D-alanyl-D-alanine ligase